MAESEISSVVCRAYEVAYGVNPHLDTVFASTDEHATKFVGELAEALGNPEWFAELQEMFHDNECELSEVVQAILDAS